MRILQVHAGYRFAAGEDTVVAAEAQALRDGGHVVEQLIVPNPTGAIEAVNALARSSHNRSTARRAEALIEAFRPDVVHVHNTWFAVSSSPIGVAASRGIPVVMTLHNFRLGCVGTDLFRDGEICTACVGRSPWAGVAHGCYRDSRALSAVQAVEIVATRRRRVLTDGVTTFVAPSDFMAERLIDMGVPSGRLVVKPHFTADPGPRANVPSAATDVVFVGRVAAGKGVETMLDAWTCARSERSESSTAPDDLELAVLGDGPLLAGLQAAPPPSVRFEGWRSHERVIEHLLTARALVFPSECYESFGMVLIEALSAGLPIVTTNASGAASIAGSPEELVVPSRNRDALARALGHLESDELVDRVGASSRRRFEAHFGVTAGLRALEALYERVAQRAWRHMTRVRDTRSVPFAGRALVVSTAGRRSRRVLALTGASDWRRALADSTASLLIGAAGSHLLPRSTAPGPGWRWPDASIDEIEAALAIDIDGVELLGAVVPRQQGRQRLSLLAGVGKDMIVVKLGRPATGIEREAAALRLVDRDRLPCIRTPEVVADGLVQLPSGQSVAFIATTSLGLSRQTPAIDEPLRTFEHDLAERMSSLDRPAGTPADHVPVHGDLTPWNLRRTAYGLALFDWEEAGWGPQGADIALYRHACETLPRWRRAWR